MFKISDKKIILFTIFCSLIFSACSHKNIQIKDVKKYSQNPQYYLKNFKTIVLNEKQLANDYRKKFFLPWNINKLSITKKEIRWADRYKTKRVFLENYRLITKQWFIKQDDNSNLENFNKVLKKAIVTKNSDIRVFPTTNKIFYNPHEAGEGFPFDYNQNSRIKLNTPVLVSHFSKDKAWAYIQSPSVFGWIRVNSLLFLNDEDIKKIEQSKLYVVVKEGVKSFSINDIENLKIGTFFPKEDNQFLVATNNGLKKVHINNNTIKLFPLKFNKKNVGLLLNNFIGEIYGWGGLNNHRDCSSFTQDFFKPFGIYIKRNSKDQTKLHEYIDISHISNKKEFILKNAIPFLTLIYLKGHIMLYIGEDNKEPMVMHNMWGIKTYGFFSEGRNIVGKTVITTLQPGIELNNINKNKTILKRVKGIVLLNKKVDIK